MGWEGGVRWEGGAVGRMGGMGGMGEWRNEGREEKKEGREESGERRTKAARAACVCLRTLMVHLLMYGLSDLMGCSPAALSFLITGVLAAAALPAL